jgi:hypothetical protein
MDVDHRPRTAWTILVQVGKGIEDARDGNLIDRRQSLLCRTMSIIDPLDVRASEIRDF